MNFFLPPIPILTKVGFRVLFTAPIIYSTLMNKKKLKSLFIEKHVKLSNSKGPDASSSIDTNELSKLVKSIRQIEKFKI